MASVSSAASLLSSTYASSTTTVSSNEDIDWDALVEEVVTAKLAKADTVEVKISDNEARIAAYGELQSLLSTVLEAANVLRAPSGTLDSADDVFLGRTAYVTSSGDTDVSDSLGATVGAGATTGSYTLTVAQLATSHKVIGTAQSSQTADLGLEGTFSLGVEDGTAVEIGVSSDMSLVDLAEAINAQSDTAGVQASILQVASGDFRLILSTVETGQTITTASAWGSDVLLVAGVTDADGTFVNELQAAQDAIFAVDGVEITRSSNEIDDVLEGVTLYLYEATPDGSAVTLEIAADVSAVKEAVLNLVDAYNAFREFAYSQQQVTSTDADGETTASVLFADGTMRNISTAITSALTAVTDAGSMAVLGLSFDESNYLVLDEDALDDTLLTDLDAVQTLLSFQMTSSSSKLLLLQRGTTTPPETTLDITMDASGSISGVSVDGDSSLFTVSGTRIIGASGSAYEGLVLVYAGSASLSVDLSFSSGLAEALYNIADGAVDANDGTLTTLVADLEDVNDGLEAKVEDITEAAETYRTNLTARYAAYQAAIEQAETMLDYLTTLIDTWNSSS
jgi:flagellar hook-associated protein 2